MFQAKLAKRRQADRRVILQSAAAMIDIGEDVLRNRRYLFDRQRPWIHQPRREVDQARIPHRLGDQKADRLLGRALRFGRPGQG
jgi:hypothetical protein